MKKPEPTECDMESALSEAANALEAKIKQVQAGKTFPRELAPASEDYVRD